MKEKKDLSLVYALEEYARVNGENDLIFKDNRCFTFDDIKAAFNAGRESVVENIPDLKWQKSSEDMTARTLFGMYSFSKSNALWFYAYRGVHLFFDTHKTFEDAKKVAHNDYKEWVKHALGL